MGTIMLSLPFPGENVIGFCLEYTSILSLNFLQNFVIIVFSSDTGVVTSKGFLYG